jgi:hypothetical protein
MAIESIVKELVENLPNQVKSHYLSRSKKEKSIELVLNDAAEQLKPVVHTLWNAYEAKEREVRTFIYQRLKAGDTKETIRQLVAAKSDPDQLSLLQLTYEEVNRQVEDEKFFVFKEIGERIQEREIWNHVNQKLHPEEKVLKTVSGTLKSEFLIQTTKQIIIVKKGLSSLLKGSFQMTVQPVQIDQILDTSITSSMMGTTLSIRYLSGSTDFKFKKEFQSEIEEVTKSLKEHKQKKEAEKERTEEPRSEETKQESISEDEKVVRIPGDDIESSHPETEEKREVEGIVCPNCSKIVATSSRYCGYCGHPLFVEKANPEKDTSGTPDQFSE